MKKKHLAEIRRISNNIPQELMDKLVRKELAFPGIKEVYEKSLTNTELVYESIVIDPFVWWKPGTWFKEKMIRPITRPMVSEEEKARARTLLASGYLDQETEVLDHEVEKQINDWMDAEFEKARKLGRLPPPQKMPNYRKKAKKLYVQNP